MNSTNITTAAQWPRMDNYNVENLNVYLEEQVNIMPNILNTAQVNDLCNKIKLLKEPKFFLPTGDLSKQYNVLEEAPSIFVEFASGIGAKEPSDKDIIKWLEDYGALFRNPVNLADLGKSADMPERLWQHKDSNEVVFAIEDFWYRTWGKYIILKDTIVDLAKIAHEAFQLLCALRDKNLGQLQEIFFQYRSTLDEQLSRQILSLINTTSDKAAWHTITILIAENWLLPIVQYYMTGAIPSFKEYTKLRTVKKRKNAKLEYTQLTFIKDWDCPDMFRAMWVQFYEQIVKNTEFRTCQQCGKIFVPTDLRQAYCPPRPGATRSRCQNTSALATFRKDDKA